MSSNLQGATAPEDVAVVGLACLYPGAPDIATFWRNIVAKASAITGPPPEAWDESVHYDPASRENDRVYCRKGGYLGPLAYFDPLEHGIMPRAVEGGEPDQWLALHVAREALRDAGYRDGTPSSRRTALILGKGNYANRGTISVVYHGVIVDYTLGLLKSIHPELTDDDLRRIREDLKRHLPRFDAETAPALISNVSVGRIANRLDLMGPSYTIDAACASSLLAVDIAVKGLRHGEFDMALVGGMQVATPAPVLGLFCQLNALSVKESIRPFDKEADGTLLSEGVGVAVLKRRSDAERDGDRVYAFVKGTGVASDGRAVSVLAPRLEGEELAVRQAYEQGGISPETIGLVEAHGTATLVGDATEIEALRRVFGERRGLPRCALGSVKSNIGHTMPAAGMAGFIKAALSLYHKVLPPTIGVTEPSPRLKLDQTPFYINTETRPWVHGDREHPRRAGVNAFGFGGINAHVVLEEAPVHDDYRAHETEWDTEVCLIAGNDRAEAISNAREVIGAIRRIPALTLADVAFTLNTRFADKRDEAAHPVVLGVVASTPEDLARKLERALARLESPECRKIKEISGLYFFDERLGGPGRLAFLFPGEGAQYVNMLADLCRQFPSVRKCFDEMDGHLTDDPRGYVLSDLVFPPPAFSDEERARAHSRLFEMDEAVEAVYTANHAVHALLTELGIRPDAVLGHSTGEISAMRAAAMLRLDGFEQWVRDLNRISRDAVADVRRPTPARLIAIGAPRERVEQVCAPFDGHVWIAMDNCRHQVVVVAAASMSGALEEACKAQGFLYEVLRFDRPYHTPAFSQYAQELRESLHSIITSAPAVPLYSATSVDFYPGSLTEIHQLAYHHLLAPVEFRRTIERMHADGIRIFVEAGPRGNLTAFVDDVLSGRVYTAIPANVSRRSGITQLNHLLAQLAAHGVPLTLAPLYRGRPLHQIDFAAPVDPRAPARPLGRVKIPTGAPPLRLSPEVIGMVRARSRETGGGEPRVPVATAADASSGRPIVATLQAVSPQTAPAATLITAAKRDDGANGHGSVSQIDPHAVVPQMAAGAGVGVGAPQVMSAFFGTMERFLAVQQELIGSALAGPKSGASQQGIRLPLIDTIVAHSPGESAIARCTLDSDTYPCLLDHTLGRNVSSQDLDLPAFPIVPFTLMTEMMAQAGALLVPGLVLIEMRDVRANRWVAIDRAPATVEMRAQRIGPTDVAVRLLVVDGDAPGQVAEGVMVFGDERPPAPAAEAACLTDAEPYRWPADRLYDEAMFHGPAFRGVVSMDRVARDGAVATLSVLDRSRLIADESAELVTDFVLLDLPGQVVGFWASQYLEEGFVILPFQMDSLKLYGGMLPAGERLTCTARITMPHRDHIRAVLDVVGADGNLWARFEGWQDRRFDVPPEAVRLLLRPEAAMLSRPCELPLGTPGPEGFVARRLGADALPTGWLNAHGGLWSRVLAATVLSRREREHVNALKQTPARRIEWLLGRIAAKDALREYVRKHFGLVLRPADVELIPDENGRPLVQGEWLGQVTSAPLVSISHVDGVAVALAGDGSRLRGVGVDLERIGRMKPAAARIAFDAQDLQFLDGVVDAREREAWSLRLWCAKEACAKATGKGLAAGIRAFSIRSMDRLGGAVSVRFEAPDQQAVDYLAFTAQDGDWITATCATAGEGTAHETYTR